MIESAKLHSALDAIAQNFDNRIRHSDECPGGAGWGQFVDGPVEHAQLGPYGTSAGLIVRALAGRGSDTLVAQNKVWIDYWWDPNGQRRSDLFPQTVRLAFMYLAMRVSDLDGSEVAVEIANALQERALPGGLWGDFWASEFCRDTAPKMFPSSIVLLAFSLFAPAGTEQPLLLSAANQIEERLADTSRLSVLHRAAAVAAVLAVKGKMTTPAGKRAARDLAYRDTSALAELGVYFYEYERLDGQARDFDRDYFIVPTAILTGIAGFQPGANAELRIRAEAVTTALLENISQNLNTYRPSAEGRSSSKNQAWASILLSYASRASDDKSVAGRIKYGLFRERTENVFTRVVLPLVAWAVACFTSVLAVQGGIFIRSTAAVGTIVIGGYFPPAATIKKMLGR